MKSLTKIAGAGLVAAAGVGSALGAYYQQAVPTPARAVAAAPVPVTRTAPAALALLTAPAPTVADLARLQPLYGVGGRVAEVDAGLAREMVRAGANGTVGFFVHFLDKTGGATAAQDALLGRMGASVVTDFRKYTDAIFVTATAANALALATDPGVYRLEWNQPLQYLNHTGNWAMRSRVAQEDVGLGPYYADAAKTKVLDGTGIGVVVIDSGVDGTHPDFKRALAKGHSYKAVCVPGATTCTGQFVDVGTTASGDTTGGHGHHVAGTVLGDGTASLVTYKDASGTPRITGSFAGVAPGATLYSYGTGEAISILFSAQAFKHLLDNIDNTTVFPVRPRVTNNSYGNAGGSAYSATDARTQLVAQAVAKGVTSVFAAGNDGDGTTVDKTSSSCKDPTPGVICVAAYDDAHSGSTKGLIAGFSGQGKFGDPANYPDIAAPGVDITSTCTAALSICKDTSGKVTPYSPNYGTISGTSMATPHVVGAIALLLQAKPELTPKQIEEVLQTNARRLADNTYGAAQAVYEPDPQFPGNTINYRFGSGLLDLPATLDALGVPRKGTLPASGEYTVIAGDANATGGADSGSTSATAASAKDIVKVTMKDDTSGGINGITYTFTVGSTTNLDGAAYVRYQVLQNVDGNPFTTAVTLRATGVTADGLGASTSAAATSATKTATTVSFFVPLGSLGAPPVGAPVHNIRVNAHAPVQGQDMEVDYAPSLAGAGNTQALQPGWGKPYTVLAASTPLVGDRCKIPGLVVGTDKGGDATTMASSQDLLSVAVAQPYVTTGSPLLAFRLKAADLNTLTPGSDYFTSFVSADGKVYGARMVVGANPAAPTFISYLAGGSSSTTGTSIVDGRFVGTATAAEAGSKYDAATGEITIMVKPANIGLTAVGQGLTGFNGGVVQNANPTGAGVNAAPLVDELPDGLSRAGGFAYVPNAVCAPNTLPTARLTADRTGGDKPLKVVFSGLTSTDPDEGDKVASYTFTFGDKDAAGNSTLPVTNTTGTVEHTYAKSGTYAATLKVTDSKGAVSATVASLSVAALNQPPTVSLKATPAPAATGQEVTFAATGADANADDAAALVYAFDMDGDGTFELDYGTASAQKKTFSAPGEYTVGVRVRDLEGLVASATTKVQVEAAQATKLDPFTFAERTNVTPGTFVSSERVTLAGSGNALLPISVAGGNGVQYSLNGGPFTSEPGMAKVGDTLVVRHTSAGGDNQSVTTSVTVGEYTTTFKSTTAAPAPAPAKDQVPDAFDFGTQEGVDPDKLYESKAIVLTGYDDAPVTASQFAEYRINGGAWTAKAGTIVKGQTLQVRHTSNAKSLGYTRSYVTVGGVKGYFTTRTKR